MTTREKAVKIVEQAGLCNGFGCGMDETECPVYNICISANSNRQEKIGFCRSFLSDHYITIYDGYTHLIAEAEKLAAEFPESKEARETVERLKETRDKLSPCVANSVLREPANADNR